MYVNVFVRLLVHYTLSHVTLHLWDRARLFCFQYQGIEWKNHLFSSFFSYFSTSHSVILSRPLKPSYLLSCLLTIISPQQSLTCLTDIDVHCIHQMWHAYLSPLDRSAVRTRSDSLAINKLAMCHVMKRYIRSQGFHSALIPVHTDSDEVMRSLYFHNIFTIYEATTVTLCEFFFNYCDCYDLA